MRRTRPSACLIHSATPELLQLLPFSNSFFSNCLGEESAVDPEVHASHEAARFFAGQEDCGAGKFGGDSKTRHRGVAKNQLAAGRGGSVLIEKQTTVLFPGKKAGRDGVHPDVIGGPFS